MNEVNIIILGIVPTLLLIWYVYTKDKLEKEPLYLLTILFIGGIFSCTIAILFSDYLKELVPFLNSPYSEINFFETFIKVLFSIALIEEGLKWITNYLITWKNKYFKHIYDPTVYCVVVSLGFATFENILYGLAFSSYGITPILMRGLISVPCHAVFGVFMGYFLGISRNAISYNKKKKSIKYRLLSIIIPVVLHTAYDLLLIKNNNASYYVFIIYIIILYLVAYKLIKKLSSINKNFKTKDM